MKKLGVLMCLLVVLGSFVFANGQSDAAYPSKDIKFISAGNAGGGADALSRKITSLVQKELDCNFYIVNRVDLRMQTDQVS